MKEIMLIPNIYEGIECQPIQDALTMAGYESKVEVVEDSLLGCVQAIIFSVDRLSYILDAVKFIDKNNESDIAIKIRK